MSQTRLSILDQSPIPTNRTATDALQATLELAQAAERWGYHRYWLAEHHGLLGLADPCPEILLTRIASLTEKIRVGTGGIMLPYYSPFKIAEQFRMLCALFPDRIDLGVGRAPGGDRLTAQAMSGGAYNSADDFPQQVFDMVGYLDGTVAENHPFARVTVQPKSAHAKIPTREEALARSYSDEEKARMQWHRGRSVIGTPDKVCARLREIQQQFEADELMVISVTGDYASRLRSYELLAAAWPLLG